MKVQTYRHSLAGAVVFLSALCLCAIPALARDEMPSQVNAQFSGLFNTDATGNGVTDHVDHSAGFGVGYTYFHKWAGFEGSYGYSRNTQSYFAGDGSALGGVQSNIHEFTGALLVRIPTHVGRARPYALAVAGGLQFRPTDDVGNAAGAASQTKGAFLYGGGADFDVSKRIGVRAEYRAFLYKAPDFATSGLTTDSLTHLAQPSVGVFFKF